MAEVGTDIAILSPITPAPIDMRWFSLNFDGELLRPVGREVSRVSSTYFEKFQETYNTSWQSAFKFYRLNRTDWLKIRKVQLGYADLFRVFLEENRTKETAGRNAAEGQTFDVAITLMTFEKHECGFTSKPQNPKVGDTLTLSCSVVVNGMWNASLIFRNDYDESEIIGETKTCGIQRGLGSKICSSFRLKAETDVLAYSCRLEFPSYGRHVPKNSMFRNSKWTAEFNKKVVCNLPKIYLEAIPSDVTLLCNNMPCGETVVVNDTVTCLAHGYPQSVFDLRIRNVSAETGDESESRGVGNENRVFMDKDEEEREDGSGGEYVTDAAEVEIKGFEDIRIGPMNVRHIEITCNVSNALGWGYNSLFLEVKSSKPTFRLEDYKWKKHQINLVNYVAKVGSDVLILSPIIPAPIGIHWFSLTMNSELPLPSTTSSHLEKFLKTYNTSWEIVFDDDRQKQWLKIQKVPLGYADVFRVFVDDNRTGNADVAITLMTFEKHECGYLSKPSHPVEGDVFILNCSVIVNGLWNTSLVFRSNSDESEIRGEMSECNGQPSTGTKICSTVRIKAETDILAYSCRLEFPTIARHDPINPIFRNSKWTDAFNKEVVCYLPEVYLEEFGEAAEEDSEQSILGYFITLKERLIGSSFFVSADNNTDQWLHARHGLLRLGIGTYSDVFVDDRLLCFYNARSNEIVEEVRVFIDDWEAPRGHFCSYDLKMKDIGTKNVTFLFRTSWRTDPPESFRLEHKVRVVPDWLGFVNILCDSVPCLDNATILVGNRIKFFIDFKHFGNISLLTYTCKINGKRTETLQHTLDVADVGRMELHIDLTYKGFDKGPSNLYFHFYRNIRILVASEWPIGIDIFCNGKACQENESMRFGDEISCYFEPKVLMNGMTFSLLIDNYVKVEGYPCMYALREEDVGGKSIQCNGNGKGGPFQKIRNISVACAFRDDVVLKQTKRKFDDFDYGVKFIKENVTIPSGLIILCGDEPCDKPGRTIYTGTYVSCRPKNGRSTALNLMLNGRMISKKMPLILSEINYQLTNEDKGTMQVKCGGGTAVHFIDTVIANFTVYTWPCPTNVLPASADIFDYENADDETVIPGSTESTEHGDAAGAIDVDQAENIDSGPASGNKGVPKGNDGMAVEKSAEDDKPKQNIGSRLECFVLLQIFLAFIAAFVGFGQF